MKQMIQKAEQRIAGHTHRDSPRPLQPTKAVVVHSGARDAYQLALALSEAGLLEALVTDLYWPADHPVASALATFLPKRAASMLLQRSCHSLPSSQVRSSFVVGLSTLLSDKLKCLPPKLRQRVTRNADATLGRKAGDLATRTNSAVVSYSYYAFDAFQHGARPGMLFQLHPHPASMRRILKEELQAHPDCKDSLRQEWELALPEADFQHLVRETAMARSHLVASSFTRRTLIDNGISASSIRVIPYGVDCERFRPDAARRAEPGAKMRLLFVGRINQRKGIKYLLQALRLLGTDKVEVTVCGRVVDGLELFQEYGPQVVIRPSVSDQELVAAYQAADLFVFPSVAEGFGQVLLEALACGLPVLSTTSTAAPDLVEDGRDGFVVEPRRPEYLAHHIEWALTHRRELARMGQRARTTAESFSWTRFRGSVAGAVHDFLQLRNEQVKTGEAHV